MTPAIVLAVDDNPANLRLLSGILQGAGYAVRAANSGGRALGMAEKEAPDLILLDINMPDMDGYEVCRALKARPELEPIPVIFLSALDDVGDKLRGFAAGAVDYVTKPFQEAEVLARVETQLRVYRLRRELEARNRELVEVNDRLSLAEARAADASRAKSAFLASMSHELRTPLNAILGFAQLMARRQDRDVEDRESLAIIETSGQHLLGLIDDVLSLSKIEAGHALLKAAPFEPGALLRGAVEMMRARAGAKGLSLELAVSGLPGTLVGDERKLGQIVLNLVGNAVKFTVRGGVTVRASWERDRLVLEVLDTGPGIAAEELARLFEPFSQAAAGRSSREGTGLGLALSRQLARLMGGDISVRSEPGQGTCFRVELPLRVSGEAAPRARAAGERRVRRLAPNERRPRLLVVDDRPEGRLLLSRLLTPVGFEVHEAGDGEEAISAWRRLAPHLVLMEMRMPRMDGFVATRRIREEERSSGLSPARILALTASALEHERRESLEAGCDAFVSKPFGAEALLETIGALLGVGYEYEAPGEDRPSPVNVSAGALDASRIALLPRSLRDDLRMALESGDFEAAEKTAERVRAHDEALGEALRAAVRDFRIEEALEAVSRAGAGSEGSRR